MFTLCVSSSGEGVRDVPQNHTGASDGQAREGAAAEGGSFRDKSLFGGSFYVVRRAIRVFV